MSIGVISFERPLEGIGSGYDLCVHVNGVLWKTMPPTTKRYAGKQTPGNFSIYVDMDGYKSPEYHYSIAAYEILTLICSAPKFGVRGLLRLGGRSELFSISIRSRDTYTPTKFAEIFGEY